MTSERLFSLTLLIAAGAGYGSIFIANKVVISSGLNFIVYIFWMSFFSSFIALILFLFDINKIKLNLNSILHFNSSAFFGMILPFGIIAALADSLPAGILTLTFTLAPAFTYTFSFILKISSFNTLNLLGLVFGLIGVLLIILPDTSLPNSKDYILVLIALLAPLGASINNIIVAKLRPTKMPTSFLVLSILLSATVIMLLVSISTSNFDFFWNFGKDAIVGVLWASFVQVLGYYALYEVIRKTGPIFFSQIAYIVVGTGILWAYIFLDEKLSSWIWIAIVFLVLGLFLSNLGLKKENKKS